jgi:hypothetical protein
LRFSNCGGIFAFYLSVGFSEDLIYTEYFIGKKYEYNKPTTNKTEARINHLKFHFLLKRERIKNRKKYPKKENLNKSIKYQFEFLK